MRPALIAVLALLALTAAGCGKKQAEDTVVVAQNTNACAHNNLTLRKAGKLALATSNPAHPPWFAGGTKPGSPWKINDPSNGQGFESAIAYAVAKELGFTPAQVTWTPVTPDEVFAAGPKPFDLALSQHLFTDAR